jgi:hypothetical protein
METDWMIDVFEFCSSITASTSNSLSDALRLRDHVSFSMTFSFSLGNFGNRAGGAGAKVVFCDVSCGPVTISDRKIPEERFLAFL